MNKSTYLKYSVSTLVDERVIEKMVRYLMLNSLFGNPASRAYYPDWAAENAINPARGFIAEMVGAESKEIIFTSGVIESNCLAINGTAIFYKRKGRHIITCKTEHKAVLDTYQQLEDEGYKVTYLMPQHNGSIDIAALKLIMHKETILVSITYDNNHIDVIKNIAEIGKACRKQGVIFHVDATQYIGKVPINLKGLDVDLMSLSSSKMYGPKGVGGLYVRCDPRVRINCRYSENLPIHKIVGMGEAYRIAKQDKRVGLGYSCQLCDW